MYINPIHLILRDPLLPSKKIYVDDNVIDVDKKFALADCINYYTVYLKSLNVQKPKYFEHTLLICSTPTRVYKNTLH